ncbi:hypothetical protein, conserved [Trypanosoma brucei gambiense DAL972]|uniref:SP-RING-type domain-containing protein n=1 Tax=Trypanosoma brucei gambiense (strain MHOM/CI/86/DAL972) TaxID=679716 RepID=C9ZJE6_TRYB9|nr:hypothetical protein, conserved [Trypanosoma brucei gambiense DAL972]CBH09505.1 hypothetical protein, conserved [Trypanosoma brucei gambiense DAL972]|eukprot:XP_011771810.1 hypothetical protein, conserved [Trypanosoma brucei gambiense DAL972]
MLPPVSVQSPCFPILSLVRRFDLSSSGGSDGIVLQKVGVPPSSARNVASFSERVDLVLFPCKLGDPAQPIGWPQTNQQEFTVMVNDRFITSEFPRCPSRSASHRTLAGMPLSSFLPKGPDGGIAAEAELKILVVRRGKWTATFLLAWCNVIEPEVIIDRTIARLLREPLSTPAKANEWDSPSSSASAAESAAGDSDIDVDSGWVDDKADNTHNSGGRNGRKSADAPNLPNGIAGDNGVQDGEAVVTLRCPLSYGRMKIAGRGNHCSHLTCFDLLTYLSACLQSNSWNCPICDGPVFIGDVCIDSTLQAALEGLDSNAFSVVLFGRDHKEWRSVEGATCGSDEESVDGCEVMMVEEEEEEEINQQEKQQSECPSLPLTT